MIARLSERMGRRLMVVVWPAFLTAGVLEMLVFAFVDPSDVTFFGRPVDVSRAGVYTLAFFAFWIVTALSGALTVLLLDNGEKD